MTPRPSRRRRSSVPLVTAALIAGAVGAGGTVALWNADAETPLGLITAGNLDIDLVGEPVWHETSADVVSTPEPIDADFHVRPGDTVTMEQAFTTELQGDNLLGRLTVDWSRAPALPDRVDATYSVRTAAGDTVLDDVDLGTSATIEDLHAGDDTRTGDLILAVAMSFTEGMTDRFHGDPDEIADLGAIVIELDQVRTGEGFQP